MADAAVADDPRRALQGPLKAADYHRIARAIATQPVAGMTPLKLALLSSYSANFLKPYLIVEAARRDFSAQLHFGAFGQFEQELTDGGSSLWSFAPDAVVIAMRPEDVDPEAVDRFHATGGKRFTALADTMLERITQCVHAARARMNGPVLVANVATTYTPLGPFDAGTPGSLTHAIADLNQRLADLLRQLPGAYLWDYAGVVRAEGAARWTDARMWSLARAAIAQDHQPALASHLLRTLAATLRTPSKCLVLDLDNTIWGGVIGDDGPGGIQLSDDYPGNTFKQFQRAVLGLIDRGILLAVSSKNNPEIVEETLRSHPEMVLRWDDFACVKANWRSKSENIREIAKELNIGVDALVLFDDNPVERAEVHAALPQVGIIDVPTDPIGYVAALRDSEFFDQPVLSAEDRDRAAMYRRERDRQALAEEADSPEAFLRSLDMEAEVGLVDDQTIGRIAQLVNKTNQFNLTTRRHNQAEIAGMAADTPNHRVAWLRLRDRFGDQGLVVVGIIRRDGVVGEIDTFLMSCRVMNRRVEHAFMAYLMQQARDMGCTAMRGSYLPTAKNSMVSQFYPDLGFATVAELDGGGRTYRYDMTEAELAWPDVIRRR